MKLLPVNSIQTTNDYPYGRLRATASFAVEFAKNKGFRSVFQTVNPKDGRINKPKKGVYHTFMYMTEEDNGHFVHHAFNVNGIESTKKLADFLAANFDALEVTPEMVINICGEMLTHVKISLGWKVKEHDQTKVLELAKPTIQALFQGFKTGENVFDKVTLTEAAILEIPQAVQTE